MIKINELPWEKIHQFLLYSGSIREPKLLSVEIAKSMFALIPYDQARIYFINDFGQIYDEVLFGVDESWSKAYVDYYSQVENGRYSATDNLMDNNSIYNAFRGNIRDWTRCDLNEFTSDYIKPQGLRYSLGFALHDASQVRKCVYTFDRTNSFRFTAKEIGVISVIQPHLENLHQNLHVLSKSTSYISNNAKENLTPREKEIIDLLCSGISTDSMSKKLFISVSTVYRHIANIYCKLEVNSRQELMAKFLYE